MTLDQWRDLCRVILTPFIGDDVPDHVVIHLMSRYPGREA